MSLQTVADAIQDIIGASTRITSAPHIDAWPSVINDADLPMALTRPGPGRWPHECLADVWARRTYISEIYVRPNVQGLYYEGIQETLAIIQDLGQRLTTAYTLSGAAIDSEPRDRGLMILEYGGGQYRGAVFELEVTEDV